MAVLSIEDFYSGQKVIAIDDIYSGLIGYVSHTLTGDEKETENEDDEIVVDFEQVENMEEKYSELNGTGIDQLVMGIEELAIIKEDGTAIDYLGNVYLPQELIRK